MGFENKDNKLLVIYRNEMNTVPLRKFSSTEMDLFFSLCTQVRNKGIDRVSISFEELKNISNYTSTSLARFVSDLESVYKKLLELTYRRISADGQIIEMFVLFTGYEIDKKNKTITIQTNEKFSFMLNDITAEFTQFELSEFVQIKSSYSKTMYRLLKQYRRQGYFFIKMDDFRRILSIPDSYPMCKIDEKVLSPILSELGVYFKKLSVNKIKKGKIIDILEFSFSNESNVLSCGNKLFRDKNGSFYTKHLYEFTEEEVRKTYPENPTVSSDKKRFNVNKQLLKKTTKTRKKKNRIENSSQLIFNTETDIEPD